ncbi:MAG: hypothetical protein ABI131_07765 [Nostocoides sp.]
MKRALWALAATLALTTACTASVASTASTGTPAGSWRGNGVEVTLRWAAGSPAGPVLAAEFLPTQPGFHLYSVDLPDGGLDGVGRPTKVDVGGALSAVGPASADVPVVALRVVGLADPLPVYPDGRVTVRQVVRVNAARGAEVFLTYAACSRTACLPPVSRQRVDVSLPPGS